MINYYAIQGRTLTRIFYSLLLFFLFSFIFSDSRSVLAASDRSQDITFTKRFFDSNPFGLAYGGTYKGGPFLDTARELGAGCVHINIRIPEIITNQGIDWTAVDSFVAQLNGDCALIRIKSGDSKSSPSGISMPEDLEQYEEVIRNIVRRTNGKVRFFENDWEPDNKKFWNDTPENYLELLKLFSKAVKQEQPGAIVIMGGHSGHFNSKGRPASYAVVDYALKNGSAYFDVFDLHLYHDLYTIPYRVNWFRTYMERLGIDKPIFVTEYGGPTPMEYPDQQLVNRLKMGIQEDFSVFTSGLEGYPDDIRMFAPNIPKELDRKRDQIQADEIIQRTLLALSSGVDMVWYWNMVSGGEHPVFGKLGLTNKQGGILYSFDAYKRTEHLLAGIACLQRIDVGNPDVFFFRIKKRTDNKNIYVVWAKLSSATGRDGNPVKVALPLPWGRMTIKNLHGSEKIETSGSDRILLINLTASPLFIMP